MTSRLALTGLALALPIAAVSFAVFEGLTAVLSCLLGWTMATIAVSDARQFIIPDELSLPAIPVGIVAAGLTATQSDPDQAVLQHAASAVLTGLAFYCLAWAFRVVRGRDGLGLGDVKLAAAAGAWTGWSGVTLVVLCACLGAICFAIYLHLVRGRGVSRTTMIPFGAFLAPSTWLVWSALMLASA
ncbi:MAG: prepilin peptidase [Methyloligellaceae bacterium]